MLVGHKVIGSILITVSIACVVILIISSLGKDKNAPEISFEQKKEITYEEGKPESELLEDVTAFDKEDGEVTENLVVESVYDFNNGKAKVVYVVRDASGNIAKAERVISYVKAKKPEVTPPAVDAFTREEASENSTQAEVTEQGELRPDGVKPVLRLKADTVTIKKGETFNEISYVDAVADDKDKREQLFRRISVKGECNTRQAGTYKLSYRVTDSDGNVSDEKVLTVVVE